MACSKYFCAKKLAHYFNGLDAIKNNTSRKNFQYHRSSIFLVQISRIRTKKELTPNKNL
jgi:hypothetical protein